MKLKTAQPQTAILVLALALSALCAIQPLRAQETNNPASAPSPEELAARVAAAAQQAASTNAAFNSPPEHVVRRIAPADRRPPPPARWVEGVAGQFTAINLAFQATVSGTLDVPGCLAITVPGTEPSKVLKSTVLGLAYCEPEESGGRSVVFARVKSRQAQLVGQDRLIFRDCFAGDGINADVVYKLSNNYSLSQLVVIRGRLPGPEYWNLSENSVLMVVSEFFDPPSPLEHAAPGFPSDVVLRWEPLQMIHGRAVGLGDEADPGVGVDKSWLQTSDGRRLLLESLPHRKIKAKVEALPILTTAADKLRDKGL